MFIFIRKINKNGQNSKQWQTTPCSKYDDDSDDDDYDEKDDHDDLDDRW